MQSNKTAELSALVEKSITARFDGYMDQLARLVAIPSIAWDAFDPSNLTKSAETVAGLFRELNFFDEIEIVSAPTEESGQGAPAILARRQAKNGKPQILLYAHHDVQPPGDLSVWNSEPFELKILGDRAYGRGAADDKAGILVHLGSLQILQELSEIDPDLGISLFIEGEEEAGSPSFENFLNLNAKKLQADVIIVADSGNWTTEIPAMTTSLRGLVAQTFTIKTLDHALHSGMYGGVVPDATMALIKVLAKLYNEDGSVAIDGLETFKVQPLPYTTEQLRVDSGLLPTVEPLSKEDHLQALWGDPAVTVIGIDMPSVELSSNTLQPAVTAKVSLRIAPGQNPETALALLREHLLKSAPFGSQIEFGENEAGNPYLDDPGWAKKEFQNALQQSFGVEPVDMGVGGSIPFIASLKKIFPSAQILITGVEDPDSRAHSPNESLHIPSFKKAIQAQSLFLLGISQTHPQE
ncbi:M20/M25/M40 family metallo-hydrolase [Candidatus Rhodoluna planktonica]|uniref:Dipeptidase n=1 Tax=Candidatus Rhodoluna planktonica TaxID=535712 RepID=A0A1D9DZB3_9MICO|nr:M20/M25/M40 family metallo-hydrolase [Candidatus Rhodoluna planktonica]AOY56152.1 dipeptidase [Candidatus Rhodoluna planktonica]